MPTLLLNKRFRFCLFYILLLLLQTRNFLQTPNFLLSLTLLVLLCDFLEGTQGTRNRTSQWSEKTKRNMSAAATDKKRSKVKGVLHVNTSFAAYVAFAAFELSEAKLPKLETPETSQWVERVRGGQQRQLQPLLSRTLVRGGQRNRRGGCQRKQWQGNKRSEMNEITKRTSNALHRLHFNLLR